ncbi:MAG: ABC transporter substrate-binding protein [Raoultibacter sp.]
MEMKSSKTLTRRTFLAGSAIAAASMGFGLVGCGSGDKKEAAPAADKAATIGGGTLTAAVAYETKNYLPPNNSSALAVGSNWHVVEGLYELNMSTFKPFNALAAGDPTKVSETEYEVKLRDGAKFSDGTPVTAEDVVASYDRTVSAKGALYLSMLSFIKSVSAKDEATVKIALNHPFSLVKERLALIKVVPTKATDADLTAKPIGSGPWVYDSISESEIAFSPNANYNGDHAAKDKAMKWSIIKDDTARTTAMQEGTVMVMENVPADVADQLSTAGATVEPVQGFNLPFLMFNTKKKPFDDNRVRQAVFYAIDTEKLIANAMSGMATPLTSFLPENHANYNKAATVFTYDTEKAKSLLKEAGVTDLSITLDTTDHPWIKALSPQIKNDLEAAGIKTTIQEQASSALYANRTDVDDPQYDVALAPGDPSVFGNDPDLLMNWWYGDNTWTQKRTQWKGSDKFTELHKLMQSAIETSGDAQQKLWNQCFDLLADQVPLYPLFHRKVSTAFFAEKLDGYAPIGTTGLNFIDAASKTA